MKALMILAIVFGVYAGIVVLFESLIGVFQPTGEGTLVIATTDDEGNTSNRVVSSLRSGDQLYVAANHWSRAWYRQALAKPDVDITLDGEESARVAVPNGPPNCHGPSISPGGELREPQL